LKLLTAHLGGEVKRVSESGLPWRLLVWSLSKKMAVVLAFDYGVDAMRSTSQGTKNRNLYGKRGASVKLRAVQSDQIGW
jgi:hypothetical protein